MGQSYALYRVFASLVFHPWPANAPIEQLNIARGV